MSYKRRKYQDMGANCGKACTWEVKAREWEIQ